MFSASLAIWTLHGDAESDDDADTSGGEVDNPEFHPGGLFIRYPATWAGQVALGHLFRPPCAMWTSAVTPDNAVADADVGGGLPAVPPPDPLTDKQQPDV